MCEFSHVLLFYRLSFCLSLSFSLSLSVPLSLSVSLCLSISVSVCLSVSLSLSLFLSLSPSTDKHFFQVVDAHEKKKEKLRQHYLRLMEQHISQQLQQLRETSERLARKLHKQKQREKVLISLHYHKSLAPSIHSDRQLH